MLDAAEVAAVMDVVDEMDVAEIMLKASGAVRELEGNISCIVKNKQCRQCYPE